MSTDGIDAELLEKRLNQRSTTPLDERTRCPQCKTVKIRKRSSRDPPWFCRQCKTRFETPLEPGDDEYPEVRDREDGRIVILDSGGDSA